jgi:CBS domain containing-hemolysin-like protein
MGLLIFFFLLSIIVSFMCSVWEAVLLSITPSYVQIKMQEGKAIGHSLNEFKEDIDKPLSAILTLNTIAHTVGALGVGAQATKIWPNNGLMTGLIIPVVMTLGILILSEIIPKTIGASKWKSLAPFTVKSLKLVMTLLYPLVWFSQLITRHFKDDLHKSVLSRADFTAMTRVGAESGIIAPSESKIIDNLLKFNSVRAKDIMTPRMVVTAAPEDLSISDFYIENEALNFSRVPVFSASKDHITGYVMKDDILTSMIKKKDSESLGKIKREISVVTENMSIQQIFDKLMEDKEHIALVVDEFGGMSGVLTMEDVIETLLGMEIMDESDKVEDLQLLARKKWETRAKNLGIVADDAPEKT